MPKLEADRDTTPEQPAMSPRLPPRWFVRAAWALHRGYYRLTGGRRGLWRPKPGKWGAMRLHTVGRKTGHERSAILGYYEDGPNLVTMAMNGWAEPEPSWWLNLQAHPDATVELTDGTRAVRGRAAEGKERERLWAGWREYGDDDIDGYATRRPAGTAVVVLEPRPESTLDRIEVVGHESAVRPGIDPANLNRLADKLEHEAKLGSAHEM